MRWPRRRRRRARSTCATADALAGGASAFEVPAAVEAGASGETGVPAASGGVRVAKVGGAASRRRPTEGSSAWRRRGAADGWWHAMLKDRDDCSSAGLVGRCCRHARNCCGRGETYMPADRIEQHVVRQRMHFPFFNPSGPVDRRPAVPRIAGPGRAVSAPGQQEYTVRRPLARAGRPLGRRFDILHTVSFASAIGALSNARFFNLV